MRKESFVTLFGVRERYLPGGTEVKYDKVLSEDRSSRDGEVNTGPAEHKAGELTA